LDNFDEAFSEFRKSASLANSTPKDSTPRSPQEKEFQDKLIGADVKRIY
jgi:hypothetical protein